MQAAYNILVHLLAAAGLSVLLPAVLQSEKRRRTVLYRLGLRLPDTAPPGLRRRPHWVHALSVGEVLSALPLIRGLKRRQPDRPVVLSASTLSGFSLARQRAAALADGLYFFPYDLPFSVRRVAHAVSPKTTILVETDLWPNFLRHMAKNKVPVVLANARLSERSLRGYRRIRPLVLPMLQTCARICTQSEQEADRFAALGVRRDRITVTGSLKFDQEDPLSAPETAPAALKTAIVHGPVIVAGSTHPGEEPLLADAFLRLAGSFPGLRMVVAPRDPARAASVCRLFQTRGVGASRLSEVEAGETQGRPATVVDRIGLLRSLYGLADVAVVGGSFAPFGGHNPLEPAAFCKPVVFGADMSDFRQISRALVDAGGALQVKDPRHLTGALDALLKDPEAARAAGRRCRGVFDAHRGAVDRTLAVIKAVEANPPPPVRS